MSFTNPYAGADDEAIVVVVQQGDSDGLGLDMGNDGVNFAFSVAQTRDTGSFDGYMGMSSAPVMPQGADAASMAVTLTGSGTHDTGTEDGYQNFLAAMTRDTGAEDDGYFTASAVAELVDFTSTATNTTNAGATAWTNPTNAEGDFNGTEAEFAVSAGIVLTTGDATLKCSGMAGVATPAGFTRTVSAMAIRYRWDLVITLPLIDTARVDIELRDNAEVLISTLKSRAEDDADNNQPSLVTEVYDISALVSEAQLTAGLRIWVHATTSLSLATSGNMSVNVDGVHLRQTYTRAGIT